MLFDWQDLVVPASIERRGKGVFAVQDGLGRRLSAVRPSITTLCSKLTVTSGVARFEKGEAFTPHPGELLPQGDIA